MIRVIHVLRHPNRSPPAAVCTSQTLCHGRSLQVLLPLSPVQPHWLAYTFIIYDCRLIAILDTTQPASDDKRDKHMFGKHMTVVRSLLSCVLHQLSSDARGASCSSSSTIVSPSLTIATITFASCTVLLS